MDHVHPDPWVRGYRETRQHLAEQHPDFDLQKYPEELPAWLPADKPGDLGLLHLMKHWIHQDDLAILDGDLRNL